MKNEKSTYREWYQQNKQRLSEKHKKLYAEDPEYRQRALEASRRRRRGELIAPTPEANISLVQAAERTGIAVSTLREWRRKGLFPGPQRHNRGLWFTEKQISLLKELKASFANGECGLSRLSRID